MVYTTRYWVYHIRVTDSRFASHSLGGPYQSHVAAGGCPWVPAELREILGSVPTNSPEYLDNTKHAHPVITWLFYLFYLALLVLLQVFISGLLPVSQSYAFHTMPGLCLLHTPSRLFSCSEVDNSWLKTVAVDAEKTVATYERTSD